MTRATIAFLALVSAGVAPTAPSQQAVAPGRFAIVTTDGGFRRGSPVALDRHAGVFRWRTDGAEGPEEIPLTEVIALHGPAPRLAAASPPAVVRLVGGEELRGELGMGDAEGETVLVRSSVLGAVPLRIDRIASIAFPARMAGAVVEDLVVPADSDEDEALFVRARRGLDVVVGLVHHFRGDGILFEARGGPGPRLRAYDTLAGYALRAGDARVGGGDASVLTGAGDRLVVDWMALDQEAFTFRLEGDRDVRVQRSQVAAISTLGAAATFLSDLPIVDASERTWFGDVDAPLLPHRLDLAVDGGPLRAAGLGFAKGIGVHARCALSWQVPPGARALVGLVAVDDSATELPVRAAAVARVLLDGEVVFEAAVRVGQAPQPVGLLPVRPGATVRLEVDFGPGLDFGDRIDWLDVAFVK